jgi:hypothetical protein
MKIMFKGSTYLLVAAFVVAFLISGGVAKADGWEHHDDSQWTSNDGDNGFKADFKNFKDNGDWNGWEDDDNGTGDCDQGGGGKDRDPKGMPEPSSLALLSVGMFGLAAFLKRQKMTLIAPKAL